MSVTIPQDRLRSLIHRHETITAMLAAGPDAGDYVRLSRELAGLDPVAEKARDLGRVDEVCPAGGWDELAAPVIASIQRGSPDSVSKARISPDE